MKLELFKIVRLLKDGRMTSLALEEGNPYFTEYVLGQEIEAKVGGFLVYENGRDVVSKLQSLVDTALGFSKSYCVLSCKVSEEVQPPLYRINWMNSSEEGASIKRDVDLFWKEGHVESFYDSEIPGLFFEKNPKWRTYRENCAAFWDEGTLAYRKVTPVKVLLSLISHEMS